ncbi:uncharacterized protein LOC136028413 isoform X2 [Artemia franciscana]|uniref:uncharacterized protein LOC136028413 isoform X2 n=1 Tax=Artemia franciscana TaxID=6661 RepID=UPI0032D9F8D8
MADESCQEKLTHLQMEVARMEELMRSVLTPCKATLDYLCIDKAAFAKAYEKRLQEAHGRLARLELENRTLHAKIQHSTDKSGNEDHGCCTEFLQLFQQLRAENEALLAEAEHQRRQYERCLDDVATNVVQALMAQKALQGECQRLQRRVKELEQQNVLLSMTLRKQLQGPLDTPETSSLDALLSITSDRQKTSLSWSGSSSSYRDPIISSTPKTTCRSSTSEPTCLSRPTKLPIARSYSDQPIASKGQSGTKDEGYSTMSSDGKGEMKESDLSNCSPLLVRKQLTTRSLPGRRKLDKPAIPNRSISLQETLREEKEVSDSSESSDGEGRPMFRRQMPVRLPQKNNIATSSQKKYRKRQKAKYRHSYHYEHLELVFSPLRRTHSDSEVICCVHKSRSLEECLSSIELNKSGSVAIPHPLRRSKAQAELISGNCDLISPLKTDDSCLSGFSSDCELSKSLCESNQDETLTPPDPKNVQTNLPSIRENSVELEEDSSECAWNSPSFGQSAMPNCDWPFKNCSFKWEEKSREDLSTCCSECSSIDCNVIDFASKRSSLVSRLILSDIDSPVDDKEIDTEFTRDFYRLVKFGSSRSLATSSRSLDQEEVPPPDKQVALQSVLSFIAEQQKYCSNREQADSQPVCSKSVQVSDSPTLAPVIGKRGSALEELSRFINGGEDTPSGQEEDCDSDSGCTTGWIHMSRKTEVMDKQLRATIFNSMMVTSSSSDCLSSCCESSPLTGAPPIVQPPFTSIPKKRGN